MARRFLFLTLFLALASAARAATPPSEMISFQGVLRDANGDLLADGDYTASLGLWSKPAGGAQLWSTTTTLSVVDGVFETRLGDGNQLPQPFDAEYYLEIKLAGESAMTPRLPLHGAPFALRAKDIDDDVAVRSINGLQDSVTLNAGPNVSISEVGSTLTISASGGAGGDDGDWTIDGAALYAQNVDHVAIGTADPQPAIGTEAALEITDTLFPSLILDQKMASPPSRWVIANEGFNRALWVGYANADHEIGDPKLWLDDQDGLALGGLPPNGAGLAILGGQGDVESSPGDLWIGETSERIKIGVHTSGALAGEANLWLESNDPNPHLDIGVGGQDVLRVEKNRLQWYGANSTRYVEIQAEGPLDEGGKVEIWGIGPSPSIVLDGKSGSRAEARFADQNGNVRGWIGVESNHGGTLEFDNGGGTKTVGLYGDDGSGAGGVLELHDSQGVQTLGLYGDYQGGGGRVRTQLLEITGGADLSEQFLVGGADPGAGAAPEPGTVMSIDAANPGRLRVSDRVYDRCVAGIVSGAGGVRPGLLMGQDGTIADGDVPLALAGRVYVKADDSGGAIEPGDLLTTSDRPGHARRVDDPDRANGAIIGKAMTALDGSTGSVLVLVSLQ